MSLFFPEYIDDEEIVEELVEDKKTPREYGIDFATGQLTGEIVEGLEAIRVWIWMALQAPRYRYYVYTWDYGNEFDSLIGQGYTEEYINAEAQRLTEECLLVNDDIQELSDFNISMSGDKLSISFLVNTIYGEIEMKDQTIARPET